MNDPIRLEVPVVVYLGISFTPLCLPPESRCCASVCILFVLSEWFFFFPPSPSFNSLVTIDCDWVADNQSHKFVPFLLETFLLVGKEYNR